MLCWQPLPELMSFQKLIWSNVTMKNYNEYYIGLGEVIKLPQEQGVFLPSLAGVFFWETVYSKKLQTLDRSKKLLDLGCGSGFIAIAMAMSGFKEVVASDINHSYVDYAKKSFQANVKNKVNYKVINSNLFENLKNENFDVILFNCPGWSTPTETYKDTLKNISKEEYFSMFEGEKAAVRCVVDGLALMSDNGSIFLGLNSIMNIKYVIESIMNNVSDDIKITSLAKIELPLLLYNDMWKSNKAILIAQLHEWRDRGLSFFRTDSDGIWWTYEVVEVKKEVV